MIFLSPFSERRLYLDAGCSVLYDMISANFLESMVGIPKAASLVMLKDGSDLAKEKLVDYFDLCCNGSDASYLKKMGACFDLLRALENVITNTPAEEGKAIPRASQLSSYIDAHFREPIQLSDLADLFGVTRQHISTTLHKELGVPFSTYVQRLRLREALRLLLTTDKNITTISEESGFPNLRAFNVAFKNQHGCSPKEYRQKKASTLDDPDSMPGGNTLQSINKLLQPYRMVYAKSEEAVSITDKVTVGPGTPYAPVWQDILNVDNSADLLQSMVQESISDMQKALSFRYVRLINILCHELTPYIATTHHHRFTLFFRVIDFVKSIGLIPMLSFGESFSVLFDAVMLNEGVYSVAEEDWLEQLSSTLDASISHWGKRWVSTWRFEFHMPERLYGIENHSGFMELFAKSVSLIKSKLPEAEVGGPGLSMDAAHLSRWHSWFQGVREHNIPVDFVSMELWADYTTKNSGFSGQYGEWVEVKSVDTLQNADTSLAIQKVKSIRTMMDDSGIQAKLYVSALGITKYQAMAAQIGGHAGAYLTKCALELRNLVDGIGCWKAINNEAEYPHEYSVFGHGCGLLSREKLKNPSWYAYHFLSQLHSNLLFHGLSCFVTTNGDDHFAVLIHNCKNYSDYFLKHYLHYKGYSFQESRMYTSTSALKQSLTLQGVTPKTYDVRQYLIGDHHGNIAAILRQMGFMRQLSDNEITYVAGQSLPYQHAFQINAEESLCLTVTLQPNEVMLLLIAPEEKE